MKIKAAHAFEFAKRKIQNDTLFCTLYIVSLSIHQLFLNIPEYIVKRRHKKSDFMSICITDCMGCCMLKKKSKSLFSVSLLHQSAAVRSFCEAKNKKNTESERRTDVGGTYAH